MVFGKTEAISTRTSVPPAELQPLYTKLVRNGQLVAQVSARHGMMPRAKILQGRHGDERRPIYRVGFQAKAAPIDAIA